MVGSKEDEATVVNVANSDDSVKAMEENADPTAGWDLNKVWVYTDPDGNKVPVPIGFTVPDVESEKYVNHNVEMRGTLEELTWTPGEKTWEHDESDTDKAWKLNEDGVWVSQNYHVANSEAKLVSNEFTVGDNGGYLSIECSVSSSVSRAEEDPLSIIIVDTETSAEETLYMIRGIKFGTNYSSLVYTTYSQELSAGKYKIKMTYVKDTSTDRGLDRGYVKSGKVINYDENGADKVTVHKAGGLVIYENGDEVDHTVTETNAYEASKNRNQFVWVPVSDISRLYEINGKRKNKSKLMEYNINTKSKGYR